MKKKPLSKHYSGNNSRLFWKRVNSLPPMESEKLYVAGCILQMVEADVLRRLNLAEGIEASK